MRFFTFGHFYQSDQFLVIMIFEDKKLVLWPIFGKNDQSLIKITEDEKLLYKWAHAGSEIFSPSQWTGMKLI